MTPAEIIARKRDGHQLTGEEISQFIRGFTDGSIPDYQMAALAMAIYFQDMVPEETACLTREMLESGDRLSWDDGCLLYTSPSPRDATLSRMPSSA